MLIMLLCGTLGFTVRIETAWRDLLALGSGIGSGGGPAGRPLTTVTG